MEGLLEKHLNEALPLAENFTWDRKIVPQPLKLQEGRLNASQLEIVCEGKAQQPATSQHLQQQQLLPPGLSQPQLLQGEECPGGKEVADPSGPPPAIESREVLLQVTTTKVTPLAAGDDQDQHVAELRKLQQMQKQQLLMFHQQQQQQQDLLLEEPDTGDSLRSLHKAYSIQSEDSDFLGKISKLSMNDVSDGDQWDNVNGQEYNGQEGDRFSSSNHSGGGIEDFDKKSSSISMTGIEEANNGRHKDNNSFSGLPDFFAGGLGTNIGGSTMPVTGTMQRVPSSESLSGMLLRAIEPNRAFPLFSEQQVENRVLTLLHKHRDGLLGSDIPRFYWDEVHAHIHSYTLLSKAHKLSSFFFQLHILTKKSKSNSKFTPVCSLCMYLI
jgi:hypothetical protein